MGIYQLCYLKMHSGMLFLAGHTEDKEKETLLKALRDLPIALPLRHWPRARLPRSPIWSRENGKKCVRKS